MEREVLSSDQAVKLTVRLLTENPQPGEAVWVNFAMANLGTNQMEMDISGPFSGFDISVRDHDNNPVRMTEFGASGGYSGTNAHKWAILLQPAETNNTKLNLARYFDLSKTADYSMTLQHSYHYGSQEKMVIKDFKLPVFERLPPAMNGPAKRLITKDN